MMILCRISIAVLALLVFALPVRAAPVEVEWDALADKSAQNFHDPFADLTSEQLFHLSNVLRLRRQLNEGGQVSKDIRPRLQSRLHASFIALRMQGLDPDWLLFQGESVARRRAEAGAAGNPALSGKRVVLTGFTIPAPADKDGTPMAYLVPERGMCSHIPPPPPNQMVRMRLPRSGMGIGLYTPVSVEGRLELSQGSEEILLLDGMVEMVSSWRMSASVIAPWSPAIGAFPVPWPSGSHWRPE